MAYKTEIAQGSTVDTLELFQRAKEIICSTTQYGPDVLVIGGHALNGLLNTDEYAPGKCYYVTRHGISEC